MRSRWGLGVGALVLLTASCTGTSAPPPSDPAAPDGTSIVLAQATAPRSLDPLAGYAPYGAAKIFTGLLEHDQDGLLRPALADSAPEPSADGRTWTVHLRQDVRFSDGSTFDADDVVATYRALLDPGYRAPLHAEYPMLRGVRKTDPYTVAFSLREAYAPFPQKLVLGISPKEKFTRARTITDSTVGRKPVGTGPYELAERTEDSIVLRANKRYLRGKPKIDTVTVLFGQSDGDRLDRLRKGDIDGAPIPVGRADEIDPPDGYTVITQRGADFRAVSLPQADPVTGNPALRRALNYAVNRKSIVDDVLGGHGSPAFTPITDAQPEFVEPSAEFRYDPQVARSLLSSGGWRESADGTVRRNGSPANFPLYYRTGDDVAAQLAERFVAAAAEVGIDVTAKPVADPPSAERAPVIIDSGNPFDPDLTSYPLLHSTGADNAAGYRDSAVDSALDYGRAETDPGQRAVAYREVQRAYLADPGMVVLARTDHAYLLREDWEGFRPVTDAANDDVTWGPWWNLQTWTTG